MISRILPDYGESLKCKWAWLGAMVLRFGTMQSIFWGQRLGKQACGYLGHIQLQPVNANVAAVTVMPGDTASDVMLLVWLVRRSEGVQSD